MIALQNISLRSITLVLSIALAACGGGGGSSSSGSTNDPGSGQGSGSNNSGSQNDNAVETAITSGTAVASPKPVSTNTSSSPSVNVISYKNVARPGSIFTGQIDFSDSDGNVEEMIIAEKGVNAHNVIPVSSASGISDGTIDFEVELSTSLETNNSIELDIGLRDNNSNVSNYNALEMALSEETRYATTSYTGDFVPDVKGHWDVELIVKEGNPKFSVGTVLNNEIGIAQSGHNVTLEDSNGSFEGRVTGTENLLTITYEGTIDFNSQGVDAFADFWATLSGEKENENLIRGESNSIIQRLYGDDADSVEVYPVATDVTMTRSSAKGSDDGDSFSAASPINTGISYDRSIEDSSDVDYFSFSVDSGGRVTITLTKLSADLDLELYDAGENFLASSENPGSNSEEISYDIETAGIYYIKVFGFEGAASTYQLSVTFQERTGSGSDSSVTGQWSLSAADDLGNDEFTATVDANVDLTQSDELAPGHSADVYKLKGSFDELSISIQRRNDDTLYLLYEHASGDVINGAINVATSSHNLEFDLGLADYHFRGVSPQYETMSGDVRITVDMTEAFGTDDGIVTLTGTWDAERN